MAEGAGNPEDVHRVKVAANNALDLRGAVFDAMLLAVMPPSEEVDVGWVGDIRGRGSAR